MIKLAQIINSEKALKNLLELKLPVKIAYKLSKLVDKMQPELKIFDEQKLSLVKKLGVATENPGEFQVLPKNMEEFREDLKKLLDIDVNLEFGEGKGLEKISLADLGDISISPQDLLVLNWLIQE
jgi:hypothetical protein